MSQFRMDFLKCSGSAKSRWIVSPAEDDQVLLAGEQAALA
jgi:hypothetical protein